MSEHKPKMMGFSCPRYDAAHKQSGRVTGINGR